ncbi:MAG: MFS transporter [Planctomycetia bacterium]|nr:MFS transporter [Planctomycetia bacterium]
MHETPLPARPTSVRWTVFSLSFSISALLYLHRYAFGVMKPILSDKWGLSNTELGQLDSAFSVCYTVFQFPLAIAADALGVHVLLTVLILVWCAGLMLMGSAGSVRALWYAQAILGTGQSAVYACLSRIGRTWFPAAVRTTLLGAVGVTAGRLGALLSSLVFATLLLGIFKLTLPSAFGILVALGVANALLFALMFRNSPGRHPGVNAQELQLIEGSDTLDSGTAGRMTVGEMLRSMSPRSAINVGCLCVQTTLSTIADNFYSNWIVLFLSQVHHLKYNEMGISSSLPLLGGAIAGLIGGALNDLAISRTKNRRWSRTGVAFAGKGMAAALTFAALFYYDRPYVFCLFLFFVKLFGDWSLSSTWGVVSDIGGRATASVFAFNNSVASIGQIAAPLAYGYIADRFGWQWVIVAMGATYVLCALSWLTIDCTIPVVRVDAGNAEFGIRSAE